MAEEKPLHLETRLALAGRDAHRSEGGVNPPVQRATTLLLAEADDLYRADRKTYGIDGMAAHEALKAALLTIERGAGVELTPSGLSACTLALAAVAKAGGEMLVTDALYGPTRRFCDTALARFGVRTRYFDPRLGDGLADLIDETTCGIFLESPGSLTFEVQDVPAIAAAARARGVPVILDNTWSAGVYFDPFRHGVDISVQALTKYQSGHADVFLGAVTGATPEAHARVHAAYKQLGLFVSPDDAYLVLRGFRTLALRLERQASSALAIARWLETRQDVARVLHPAFVSHADHAIWRRDFTGASGVFGFVLQPVEAAQLKAMLESLRVFAMGFSWGGYESLIVPALPNMRRAISPWSDPGELMRLSIGLEHPEDLIADLEQAFARLT